MNQVIEGTVVEARLRRSLFGQLWFDGVTVRRKDGSDVAIGRIAAARELRGVLVPGETGRFFFHDVVGFKGLHGHAPAIGAARGAFPRLLEDAFGALTMVNLLMLATLLSYDGGLRLMPALMAALGATIWSVFAASRQAVMHDFAFEAGLTKSARGSTAQRPRHQLV